MKRFLNLYKKIIKLPKKIIIGGGIIILLTLFFLFGNKKQTPLVYAQAKKQTIQEVISGAGTLKGKNSASLRFSTSGKLNYILVSPGDEVSKWQTIAGLDTEELANALRQAENTLRDKRAIVDKIHDDLKDHQKDETYTQRQTRTTAEVAQDNAYDNLLSAQKALRDSVIYAPLSGTVTEAVEFSHQTVGPSDIIAQIVDKSVMYFDIDIDEADIGKIATGQKAEVNLDAYPNATIHGIVDRISPQTKTTSSGATVITVKIKLTGPEFHFVNGLSGQASIIIHEAENAVTIPQEALREDNFVFIQNNNRLRPQKVTPGIRSDTDVEIKNGLSENDKVLLNPPAQGMLQGGSRSPLSGIFRFLGGRGGGSGSFRPSR